MKLEIDPTVDIAFKKVFGTEEHALVLIDLVNAVIQPAREVKGLSLIQPQSDKDAPLDKQAIADVLARDQGNRQFHVEMQWLVPWFFAKRVLFYWSKFHPQQLREGENYQTLRPTISICFVNQMVFPDVPDHHLVFCLREAKHGVLWTDDIEIHVIELPKFSKTAEQLGSALDRWCYFLRHGAELDLDGLPASLDHPMIRRAMEVLTVFTQDERERAAYEQRIKFQRDQSSLLQDAREQGIEKGIEQGIEKGSLMGQIQLCQDLLNQPRSPDAALLAISQQDLAALLAQLRQQLAANGR